MEEVSAALWRVIIQYLESFIEKTMIFVWYIIFKMLWWSVRYFKMVCPHFRLKQVLMCHHPVNIDIHNALRESFVVKAISLSIFVKQSFHLMFFEVASEFVETTFELLEAALLFITKVEIRKSLFTSFPLIGLSITF